MFVKAQYDGGGRRKRKRFSKKISPRARNHLRTQTFTMLCKLWDAAANDTVGGREPHKGPKGVSKALMERYSGMGKAERKSHLAALK
jgi:hypothetical protein